MRLVVLLLLIPALAHAQPGEEDLPPIPEIPEIDPPPATATMDPFRKPVGVVKREPPQPLLMPELVARNRLEISLEASTALFFNLFEVGIGGGYAFKDIARGDIEVFGDVRARAFRDIDSDNNNGATLGNLKLGGRWNFALGQFRLAPSLTLWLPTAYGSTDMWNPLTRMAGVADGRAYLAETALGISGAAAWFRGSGFIQLEGGTAFVVDHGPQVASIYAAGGIGRQFGHKLALLAEWRFEMYPLDERLNGLGLGVIRGSGDTRLRIRFHPFSFEDAVGGACAIDILRRFQ